MKGFTASFARLDMSSVHLPSLHSPLYRLMTEDPVKVERVLVKIERVLMKLEKLYSILLGLPVGVITCLLPHSGLQAHASDQLYIPLGMKLSCLAC